MANTTSGTTTFDKTFSVDEIIEEAFERLGIQDVTGYHLKSSRRSLNIMFQEWGNRGLHYWEVGELDLDLIEGQAEYKFFRSAGDGTNAVLKESPPVEKLGVPDINSPLKENGTTFAMFYLLNFMVMVILKEYE